MTTYLSPSDIWGRHAIRETRSLIDRFWDAVLLPPNEPVSILDSIHSVDELIYEQTCLQTPEIFAKSGSRPVINVRSLGSPTDSPSGDIDGWPLTWAKTQLRTEEWCSGSPTDGCLNVPNAPQITLQPATPSMQRDSIQRLPRKPKLLIPKMNQRRGVGISSPGSALLALASDFLGVIVKLGRSQPSTPAGRMESPGVCVLESDVMITVVDDAVRSAPASQWRDDEGLDGFGQVTSAGVFDTFSSDALLSPSSTRAQAGSAEELDSLAKISWERQLMNVQGTLWH